MHSLCHITIPTKIRIDQRVHNAGVTEVIASQVLADIKSGKFKLLVVYPFLGEIENITDEFTDWNGTLIIVSVDHIDDQAPTDETDTIIYKVIAALESPEVHISSHSDNHIAFVRDYD